MVAFSRNQIVSRDEVSLYHCWARCVRRARLCGRDPLSGKDYSHRRRWIHDLAKTPETSECTSAADRNWDRQQPRAGGRSHPRSGWLTPIPITGDRYPGAARGRRASDKGLIDFDLDHYLAFLDWTGRQVRADKRGAIPADLAPILVRLGIRTESWVELVSEFGHRFRRVVGRPSEITTAASHCHQRWMHGVNSARRAFQ